MLLVCMSVMYSLLSICVGGVCITLSTALIFLFQRGSARSVEAVQRRIESTFAATSISIEAEDKSGFDVLCDGVLFGPIKKMTYACVAFVVLLVVAAVADCRVFVADYTV